MGYTVFSLVKRKPEQDCPSDLRATRLTLENDFLRIEIDEKDGTIRRLYDKENGCDLLREGGGGNRLQLLEDKPERYAAWNIGYT